MAHPSLPRTMTKEALAVWIMQNRVDTKVHTEKIFLDEEQIKDLEHKSSMASRAVDKLESQLDFIKKIFKKGTIDPYQCTVGPTKGIDILEANRKFADETITKGFTEEQITLYAIPYPEKEFIIYVNAEGEENESYREKMSEEQKKAFNTMFKDPEGGNIQEDLSQQQKSKKSSPAQDDLPFD